MAKPTMTTLFKNPAPRAETLMDKTTRAAREILDEETKKRDAKTDRLRKARLEREAGTKAKPPKAAKKAPRSRAKTSG